MLFSRPDSVAFNHSNKVIETIRAEIATQGRISFARYMQLALYAPGLGYYAAGAQKFGASGDFITAPEITPLFSRTIARYYAKHYPGQPILEFGAGSGIMAVDILRELKSLRSLPESYFIIEISPELAERQQKLIQQEIPELFARLQWLTQLPQKFSGFMVANEVLDAMPVEIFKMNKQELQQGFVDWDSQNFKLTFQPAMPELKQAFQALNLKLSENYCSEINLNIAPWVKAIAEILETGELLLIDYGYLRETYYHPDRVMGTLLCHYQHQAHSDPFLYPGLQDITAHVDFSAVISAAEQYKLQLKFFQTQAEFLLQNGLLDLLTTVQENPLAYAQAVQQVKRLTMPNEMGDAFKVLSLIR